MDDSAGEVPVAFVVKSRTAQSINDSALVLTLQAYVQASKARYKWLGGVQFIDIIPKSAAGKILRRLLRDQYVQGSVTRPKM